MTTVFLSYRRDDSAYVADRIYDHLVPEFGKDAVFMDIDAIPPGVDFREVIDEAVSKCQFFLAVIGPKWATIPGDDGRPRLHSPTDFVRLEVEAGLRRNIPVIPVLVAEAAMPKPAALPESLHPLCYRNAATLRRGSDFKHDMDRLIAGMRRVAERLRENTDDPDEKPDDEDDDE